MDNTVDYNLVQGRIRNLWENTDFTASLFDSLVGYAIIAADFDGNILAFNRGAGEIFGYGPEEVIGTGNIEMFYPPDFVKAGGLQELISDLLEKGRYACENNMVRESGVPFPAQVIFTLAKDGDGRVAGFVAIVQDITERKAAEKNLFERTKALMAIVEAHSFLAISARFEHENIYDLVCSVLCQAFSLDTVGFVAFEDRPAFAPAAGEGIDENDMSKLKFIWDFAGKENSPISLTFESGKVQIINDMTADDRYAAWRDAAVELDYKAFAALPLISTKDSVAGVIVLYSRNSQFFTAEKIHLITIFVNNISVLIENIYLIEELKRSKIRAEESESYLRNVLESIGEGLIVVDAGYRIITANRAFCEQVGMPMKECIGKHCHKASHNADVHCFTAGEECPVKLTLETGKAYSVVHTHYVKDRKPVYIEINSFPIRGASGSLVSVIEIYNDITERKRAEEEVREISQQLWQATKLATVGELAASIAHELNNPLATVSLRVESLLSQTPSDDQKHRSLEVIGQEVERMGNLVANMLQFSRRSAQQISTVDVCEEIEKTLELIYYHLRKRNISVVRGFPPEVPHIHADRQQLRQLFLNLFSNAGDAMPKGGTLTIQIACTGEDLEVEIGDTGVGIAPENLSKVMEPFFTTKPEGRGTGLGLPICKRIVEEHKGTLDIKSETGKGTVVIIALPLDKGTNTLL